MFFNVSKRKGAQEMEEREVSVVYMQRPTEISPSLSTPKRNPRKIHPSRENSSVAWHEFDDYIRKANSKQGSHLMEDLKYEELENPISSDFEFEIQEQDQELQSSDIPSFITTNGNSSLKPSLVAEPTSSKSTGSDDSDDLSQPSGVVKRKKLKLNDQQHFNMEQKDHNRNEFLAFEIKELPQSAFVGNDDLVTSRFLNPVYTDQQNVMETALVDVHLTVKASYRAENVPFVCLTSKLNGKAILGYPLEIGELNNASETLLHRNKTVARKLFDHERSRLHQLSWRTSKRTPVCYVTNSLSSSISKNVQASKSFEGSILLDRQKGLLIEEQSLRKFLKNPKQFKQGKSAFRKTCVPVEVIFSRILTAVAQLQS